MKKLPLILLAGLMIAGNARLFAQTSTQWPESSSSVSVFGSSLLLIATPVNISFEKLYLRNNIYLGYTYGPTILFLTKSLYDSHGLGGHLAFTLLTGKRNRHFEGKLGFSYTPFVLYSAYGEDRFDIPFIPVVSLGYRFQKPDGKTFYRFALSTGGFGFGLGYVFKTGKVNHTRLPQSPHTVRKS